MRRYQFSTWVMFGLALALLLIPSGRSSAQGISSADFSWEPVVGRVDQPVQFYDNSTGSPIFWNWQFGDGTFSTLPNPTHIFNQQGDYRVKMTIWDNNGDESDMGR